MRWPGRPVNVFFLSGENSDRNSPDKKCKLNRFVSGTDSPVLKSGCLLIQTMSSDKPRATITHVRWARRHAGRLSGLVVRFKGGFLLEQ